MVRVVFNRLNENQYREGGIFTAERSARSIAEDAIDALIQSGDLLEEKL
jgi:hypothetical protein